MKYISRKQLVLKIKNEKYYTADEKLFESIKEKLEPQSEPVYSRKRGFREFYRVGAGFAACFVIGFIVILAVILTSSQKTTNSVAYTAMKSANHSAPGNRSRETVVVGR